MVGLCPVVNPVCWGSVSPIPLKLTIPSGHPNAYGLFFGGSDLSGATQGYSYFVIRGQHQQGPVPKGGGQFQRIWFRSSLM